MTGQTDPALEALKRRIAQAQQKGEGPEKKAPPPGDGSAAYRMSMELVAGTLVGGLMGYGFDELLGTLPLATILLLLAGFAAGMRNIFRSALQMQKERQEREQRK